MDFLFLSGIVQAILKLLEQLKFNFLFNAGKDLSAINEEVVSCRLAQLILL
jgi:hypothetical protein